MEEEDSKHCVMYTRSFSLSLRERVCFVTREERPQISQDRARALVQ